eukprot:2215678-Lingulodinium_polyedra.AAC.1
MTDVGSASPPTGQEAQPPAPDAGTTGEGVAAPGTVPKAHFPVRSLVEGVMAQPGTAPAAPEAS